jgi:hypothetical protein
MRPSTRTASAGRTFDVRDRRRRLRWPAVVAVAVVAVGAVFGVRAFVAAPDQDAAQNKSASAEFVDYMADDETLEDEGATGEDEQVAYASTADAIRTTVPTVGELSIAPFSLTDATPPSFDTTQRQTISRAVDRVEENGSCSFVFIDLASGRGLASNADAVVYSASSIKAPFVYYVLTRADAGDIELSDDVRQSIENVIVNSDNDAYARLHELYEDDAYHAWAQERGIDDEEDSNYALISARSMAAVWSEIEEYCNGGSDLGAWFKQLLGETTSSFIRNGLDGAADAQATGHGGNQGAGSFGQQIGGILSATTGSGAAAGAQSSSASSAASSSAAEQTEVADGGWTTEEYRSSGTVDLSSAAVYDKAGWISDDYWGNAVNDCAFIEMDGRVYLLSIITSQPDDASSEQAVANLAYALMSSREALAA